MASVAARAMLAASSSPSSLSPSSARNKQASHGASRAPSSARSTNSTRSSTSISRRSAWPSESEQKEQAVGEPDSVSHPPTTMSSSTDPDPDVSSNEIAPIRRPTRSAPRHGLAPPPPPEDDSAEAEALRAARYNGVSPQPIAASASGPGSDSSRSSRSLVSSDGSEIAQLLATKPQLNAGHVNDDDPFMATLPPRKGAVLPPSDAVLLGKDKSSPSFSANEPHVRAASAVSASAMKKAEPTGDDEFVEYAPIVRPPSSKRSGASSSADPTFRDPKHVQAMLSVIESEVAALREKARQIEAQRRQASATMLFTPTSSSSETNHAPLPLQTNLALSSSMPNSEYHPDVPPMRLPGQKPRATPSNILPPNPRTPLHTTEPQRHMASSNHVTNAPAARLPPDAAYAQQLRRRDVNPTK